MFEDIENGLLAPRMVSVRFLTEPYLKNGIR